MTVKWDGKEAILPAGNAGRYACIRPERTLLYQIIEQYYPAFVTQIADRGVVLPPYV